MPGVFPVGRNEEDSGASRDPSCPRGCKVLLTLEAASFTLFARNSCKFLAKFSGGRLFLPSGPLKLSSGTFVFVYGDKHKRAFMAPGFLPTDV